MERFLNMQEYCNGKVEQCEQVNRLEKRLFSEYGVKKGLRDESGNGVLVGLTNISSIHAFREENGVKIPCDGELRYRGYDVRNLVHGSAGNKFGFEESAYLLLFGALPNEEELTAFRGILENARTLPTNFTRDVIMKASSADLMNSITKSVLTLASYDKNANSLELDNVLRQSIELISIFPMLAVYAYHAYNHYDKDESMYIHRPEPGLSSSENFLRMLRPNMTFTDLEAKVLDVALILHMEHGGGNNSTFTTRTVTSSGTDTYSAIAAALCSLKGPKHGGANIMVMKMMDDIRDHVKDCHDEEKIRWYLDQILNKKAFDKKGLIYGMGHAVYSLSDPREQLLKSYVERLAAAKHASDDLALYMNIEKIAPQLIAEERKIYKGVSPNVDFYSGFVYSMLGIPVELYTPLFAVARIVGWSAHRMEELVSADKIMRPAYRSLAVPRIYVPMEER